jgi:hypothetical protein
MEQYKLQDEEKKNIIEAKTTEDTRKMKELLHLRNQILEFEKTNEKARNDTLKDMEAQITEMRAEAGKKMETGGVKVKELEETILSKEDIRNEKILCEFQISEWRNECSKLQ